MTIPVGVPVLQRSEIFASLRGMTFKGGLTVTGVDEAEGFVPAFGSTPTEARQFIEDALNSMNDGHVAVSVRNALAVGFPVNKNITRRRESLLREKRPDLLVETRMLVRYEQEGLTEVSHILFDTQLGKSVDEGSIVESVPFDKKDSEEGPSLDVLLSTLNSLVAQYSESFENVFAVADRSIGKSQEVLDQNGRIQDHVDKIYAQQDDILKMVNNQADVIGRQNSCIAEMQGTISTLVSIIEKATKVAREDKVGLRESARRMAAGKKLLD